MMGVILVGIAAPRASADPNVWLRIMAFTDAPVVGADVRVSDHGSQGKPLVDVQAATNSQGVFPVEVPSHLEFFRVTISGGTTNGNPFPWHLMADVELTDLTRNTGVAIDASGNVWLANNLLSVPFQTNPVVMN